MSYIDPATVSVPATGESPPAAWGTVVRDDLEFFAREPQCSLGTSAPQSVSDNTLTALSCTVENWDNDSMHSGSSSEITINTPGKYLCSATVSFAADADGWRLTEFKVNASTVYTIDDRAGSSVQVQTVTGMRRINLVAGDTVEVYVHHTANNSLNVTLEEFAAKWDGF